MKSAQTIKDLAANKELGASEMSAIVVAPVTQVDATSKIDNTLLQNFGGFQLAKVM